MNQFKEKLQQFDGEFETAQAPNNEKKEFSKIPPGLYVAKIEKVSWEESKNGKMYLNQELTIDDGEFTGRKVWKTNYLATSQNVAYLKGDLEILALSPKNLSSFDLSTMLDIIVEIKITYNQSADKSKEYCNVFFKTRLEAAEHVPDFEEETTF